MTEALNRPPLVIRPEGPGWMRLRALTLSHAVGPNRLPQLTQPLQVGWFRFLRFQKSVDTPKAVASLPRARQTHALNPPGRSPVSRSRPRPLAPSFRPVNFQPGARWSRLGLWLMRSRIVRARG